MDLHKCAYIHNIHLLYIHSYVEYCASVKLHANFFLFFLFFDAIFSIAHDTCTRICLCVHVYRILLLQKRDLVQCEVYSPCIKYIYVYSKFHFKTIIVRCLILLLMLLLLLIFFFFCENLYVQLCKTTYSFSYPSSVLQLFFFLLLFLQFYLSFLKFCFCCFASISLKKMHNKSYATAKYLSTDAIGNCIMPSHQSMGNFVPLLFLFLFS